MVKRIFEQNANYAGIGANCGAPSLIEPFVYNGTYAPTLSDGDFRAQRHIPNVIIDLPGTPPTYLSNPDWVPAIQEWHYRYSPSGEREQKRMVYSPEGDYNGNMYPWTYYLLGADSKQLAVYQGAQVSDQNIKFDWYDYDSMRWRTGIFTNTVEFPTHNFDKVGDGLIHRNAVFMFPAEYNTYGNESAPIVSWRTNSKGALQKVYRVFNNQDTPILEMTNENFRTVNPLPLELKTYGPYGEDVKYSSFTSLNETNNRIGYIGKETDSETGLSDHGVRKYNKNNGRFLTTDLLWEKYPFWNPYQYCMNNPVSFVDENGMFFTYPKDKAQKAVYKSIIAALEKTTEGKKIIQEIRNNKEVNVTLGFGSNSDVTALGSAKANYMEKSLKLVKINILIDPKRIIENKENVAPVAGHEFMHAFQWITNFTDMKKHSDEVEKDPTKYDSNPKEVEANDLKHKVEKEIPAEDHKIINEAALSATAEKGKK